LNGEPSWTTAVRLWRVGSYQDVSGENPRKRRQSEPPGRVRGVKLRHARRVYGGCCGRCRASANLRRRGRPENRFKGFCVAFTGYVPTRGKNNRGAWQYNGARPVRASFFFSERVAQGFFAREGPPRTPLRSLGIRGDGLGIHPGQLSARRSFMEASLSVDDRAGISWKTRGGAISSA